MRSLRSSFPHRSVGSVRKAISSDGTLSVDFTVQSQGRMINWCWAAVSASVSAYYPRPPAKSQCEVARLVLSGLKVDCCASPHACDRPSVLDTPLRHVGHFSSRAGGWVVFDTVVDELRAKNPLPICVRWQNRGNHFLAIYGMQDLGGGNVQVWLTDPIFGRGAIAGDALINGGYQAAGGHWTDTYSVTG